MKELTNKEIKAIELELISEFHNICINNSFHYSICGGTLIGAIRHNGFIPWDDDIDVIMPRNDFDAFILYCKANKTDFGVLHHSINKKYYDGIAKIYNTSTIIDDNMSNFRDLNLGVFLDIFPVDGAGSSYKEAVKVYKSTRLQREILIAKRWKKYRRSMTHSIWYEPIRLLFFLIAKTVNVERMLDRIDEKHREIPLEFSEYAVSLYGSYRLKEIMPSKLFKDYIMVEFENITLCALKEYDSYLTNLYGDYMQLPPIEKRVSRHGFSAFIREQNDSVEEIDR